MDSIGPSVSGLRNSQCVVARLVNPLATLIDSVALQPDTTQWNDIAVAIGRYAESSNDDIFFDFYNDDKPFPDPAQALGNLLGSEHGDAIMTALAPWDSTGVAGSAGPATQFGQNATELAHPPRTNNGKTSGRE